MVGLGQYNGSDSRYTNTTQKADVQKLIAPQARQERQLTNNSYLKCNENKQTPGTQLKCFRCQGIGHTVPQYPSAIGVQKLNVEALNPSQVNEDEPERSFRALMKSFRRMTSRVGRENMRNLF